MTTKARITDIACRELSGIFSEHKGEQWAPVNPDAKVLLVKGGPKDGLKVKGSPKFIERFTTAIKGVFGPISVDVADDIDGDGDGADDYNEIACAVQTLSSDIYSAWGISDPEARAMAVKCAIDNFLECMDKMRGGDAKAAPIDSGLALALALEGMKAGRVHSSATMQHIEAIAAAHQDMQRAVAKAGKATDAMKEHVDALMANQPKNDDSSGQDESKATFVVDEKAETPTVTVGDLGEDGDPVSYEVRATTDELAKAHFTEWIDKAKKEGKYGNVTYADEKNKKYPIDTEEHIRAAWSYINMPKNAKKYSSSELKTIKDKIRAAMKRIGADVEDDGKGAPVGTVEPAAGTLPNIDEVIAKAMNVAKGEMKAEVDAAVAKAKSDSDAAIAAVKAESDGRIAELQGKLDGAEATIKAMVGDARKPTSSGGVPVRTDSGMSDPLDPTGEAAKAAALKQVETDPSLSKIGRIVVAARINHNN